MLVAKRKALHLPADSHSLRRLYHRAAAPHPQGDRQCLPSSHQAYPGVFRRHRDERHRRTGGARLSGKDEGSREEQAYHRKCAGRHFLHFSYWCAEYHGTNNPALLAKLPSGMQYGRRKEPTEEQRRLINAHPEGCGFWAWLFEYTGLRMGEANGLRWQDVDLAAGTITPMQAMPWYKNQPYKEKLKTENAYRSIPILSPLRPLLEAGKAAHRPEDYVMSGADTPLTQCQYRRRWIMYCRQLGLCESYMAKYKVPATSLTPAHTAERLEYKPLVTAHQFRHLFATNLFYAGVPDMVAQRLLGHADIMTTRRVYQHIREAEDAKYTAQLDAYVSGVH